MRRTLARDRDTLTWSTLADQAEVERLKRSAQETDLDYRTEPNTYATNRTHAMRLLALEGFVLLILAVFVEAMQNGSPWLVTLFLLPLSALFLLIAFFRWLYPKPSLANLVIASILFILCLLTCAVMALGGPQAVLRFIFEVGTPNILIFLMMVVSAFPILGKALSGTLSDSLTWAVRAVGAWVVCFVPVLMPDQRFAYAVGFGTALFAACVVSHLVAEQYAAYLVANERIPFRTAETYRSYWQFLPRFFGGVGPPELRSYSWSYVVVAVLFAVGFKVTTRAGHTNYPEFAGLLGACTVGLLIPVAWFLMGGPWSFGQAATRCWHALVVFLFYDRHQTTAAGVFRFPRRWLRPTWRRDRTLSAVFLLTLTAVLCMAPQTDPFVARPAPKLAARTQLTEDETLFMQQLPQADQTRYASAILRAEAKKAETARERWSRNERAREAHADVVTRVAPVAAVGLSLVMPVGLFFLVFTFTSGRLLCAYYQALEAPEATALPVQPSEKALRTGEAHATNAWDNRIERIIESRNPDEREHLYLGRSLYGDYPVLLHRKLLERHAHILGSSGSNKTSIGMAPLLSQILAREDSSVIIIDLKGDMAFFECARREALWAGLPFRWFTNVTGRSSYLFNPLDQSHLPLLSVNQQTQIALQALSLEYGEDYGRGYYSAMMETVLAAYLGRFPEIRSFRDLSRYISDPNTRRTAGLRDDDLVDTKALEVTVKRLAQLNALNLKQEDLEDRPGVYDRRIDLPELLVTPQVIYFYLSAPQEPKTVSMIGKLALFTLLSAAAQTLEGERRQVYIFADEFQRLLSQSLEIFFEQARSMKLAFILANQDLSQLRNKGVDILALVDSCTAFKQIFTAHDINTMQLLEQISGEAQYHTARWTEYIDRRVDERADGVFGIEHAPEFVPEQMAAVNVQEGEGPRLERNTIIEVSADQFGSFVRFAQSSGFTRFSGYVTPLISEYHVTQDEYRFRANAPWPGESSETLTVTTEKTKAPESPFLEAKRSGPETYPLDQAIDDRLDRL